MCHAQRLGHERKSLPLPGIAQLAREAVEQAQQAASLEQGWRRSRGTKEGRRKQAAPVDAALDRVLGGISQHLGSIVHTFGDQGIGARANQLLQSILPEGAAVITNMNYENELAAVEVILRELRESHADDVLALGPTPFVERLSQPTAEFREVISVEAVREIGYDQVRQAQSKGQEALLRVVAKIVGDHSGSSSEEASLRHELMAPILSQNQRIAESFSTRSRPSDINPQTGQEVPSEELAGGDAEA